MSHPDGSMVHDVIVEALEMSLQSDSHNERYLAQLALDLLAATRTHPAVIDIVNKRALEAMDQAKEN